MPKFKPNPYFPPSLPKVTDKKPKPALPAAIPRPPFQEFHGHHPGKDNGHATKRVIELLNQVIDDVRRLSEEHKTEAAWFKSHANLVTLKDLKAMERKIMSVISEFATKQTAFNERQSTAIDGLSTDVKALQEKIEELQNSPGEITPEDQALLDDLTTRAEGITAKLEALDNLTPPVPPTQA